MFKKIKWWKKGMIFLIPLTSIFFVIACSSQTETQKVLDRHFLIEANLKIPLAAQEDLKPSSILKGIKSYLNAKFPNSLTNEILEVLKFDTTQKELKKSVSDQAQDFKVIVGSSKYTLKIVLSSKKT